VIVLRRIRALVFKELREHILVLLFVGLMLALMWLLFVAAVFGSPTTITYLEAHGNFVRFALPMTAMALGNRLVVAELSGRTQKFLESLPMRPWEPLVVKWCFGLSVLLGFAFASLFGNVAFASMREPIDPSFLGLLTIRTVVGMITLWSFFFAMGLFGKLRVPLYLLLGLGLLIITNSTSLELMHFGPFSLLGQQLTLDRSGVPWLDVGVCLALSAAFLGVGALVTTVAEGSVEERLAKPMSQRELVFGGIATVALLVIWGELTPSPEPAPYVMPSDHVAYASSLPIAVGYLEDDAEPPARALLVRLEADMGSFAQLVGWARLPQVRVVLRRSLDGRTFEPVGLAQDDGVLVRANFLPTANLDLSGLSAQLLGDMIEARTRGRSGLPPRAWLRDGVSMHWALRNERTGSAAAARTAQARWLAHAEPLTADTLRDYQRLRETYGHEVIASFFGAAVDAIHAQVGDDAFAALLDRAFPPGAPNDVRVVFTELFDRLPSQIEDTTGLDAAALATLLTGHFRALESDAASNALLTALGSPTAELEITNEGTPTLVVRAALGAADGRVLTVRHLELGPFDRPVEDHEMVSETATPDEHGAAEVRIVGRYAAGSRVLVVVDVESSPLEVPIRLLARRLEIP